MSRCRWRELLDFVIDESKKEAKKPNKELPMVTWRKLLEFISGFCETDLKKEILISNPSKKLHFVAYTFRVETNKDTTFPEGTKYIKAGAKPSERTNQLYVKWEELGKFIKELKEEELDQQAFICSPKWELHVISSFKKIISDGDWFARETIYLQAGNKKYKYWFSHFEKGRICICRGFKEINDYKFLELKYKNNQFNPDGQLLNKSEKQWVIDEDWHQWSAYTEYQKLKIKKDIKEATEEEIQKIISMDGTSEDLLFEEKAEHSGTSEVGQTKEKSTEEEKERYKYWYEHLGDQWSGRRRASPTIWGPRPRLGGKIYLYRGIKSIEENCLLNMSTGIWVLENFWSKTSRGYPLPPTVISIPFKEVDRILSLVNTSNLLDEPINIEDLRKNPYLSVQLPHKHKYWYIHVKENIGDSIYLYRNNKLPLSYKKISTGSSGIWKQHNLNWNDVNYSGGECGNPTIPMELNLLKKNLIEISESEVERILSIVGEPDTFDCKTHITKYKYWYLATQKSDSNGRLRRDYQIKQRRIYLCRGYQTAKEYCLLEITLDPVPEHGAKWVRKNWTMIPCLGIHSLLKDQDHMKTDDDLKQISNDDADKILALEGAQKTFICRKIIDWTMAEQARRFDLRQKLLYRDF